MSLAILFGVAGLFGCEKTVQEENKALTDRSWESAPFIQKSLFDRVALPTRDLLEHLRFQNKKEGRSEPTTTGIDEKDLNLLRGALSKLPRKILVSMNAKLVTISVVNDLGSSGYSNLVLNKDGFPSRGFIVVDKKLLSEAPNDWITRRESSPFNCVSPEKIVAKITSDARDRESALQYILLHEFAHVFSEGTAVNPFLHDRPDQKDLDQRDYGPLSWRVVDSHYVGKADDKFPDRARIQYYPVSTPSLSCSDAVRVYSELEVSAFPALYAVRDPFEDFAESFANYVHVVIMKRPFEIGILRDDKTLKKYSACWAEPRCAEKKKYIDRLYSSFGE